MVWRLGWRELDTGRLFVAFSMLKSSAKGPSFSQEIKPCGANLSFKAGVREDGLVLLKRIIYFP